MVTANVQLQAGEDGKQQHDEMTNTKLQVAAESASASTGDKKEGQSVSFDKVVLHVHPVIIGKPPCVPIQGIPITIAWHTMMSLDFSVDQFENLRGPTRTLKQLKIPPTVREKWLREVGYTRQQIEYARSLYCEGGIEEDFSGGRIREGTGGRKSKPKKKSGDPPTSGGLFACCMGKEQSQTEDPE